MKKTRQQLRDEVKAHIMQCASDVYDKTAQLWQEAELLKQPGLILAQKLTDKINNDDEIGADLHYATREHSKTSLSSMTLQKSMLEQLNKTKIDTEAAKLKLIEKQTESLDAADDQKVWIYRPTLVTKEDIELEKSEQDDDND